MSDNSLVKIGIDCRLSGSTHAGIGRYIEELIIRLPSLAPDKFWVFFFSSSKQATEYLSKLKPKPSNFKIVIVPIGHYSLAEQFKLPKIFGEEKLDLLHVPHFNVPIFYRGKMVVTIHDLLWHEFRGLKVTTLKPILYYLKYWAYRLVTRLATHKAKLILVPAQTIKEIVSHYYPQSETKTIVTTEGFSGKFIEAKPATKPSKNILYVGSLYPHKNIEVVLKALKSLPDYNLKLIGSRNIFSDQTKLEVIKLEVHKQVDFVGFLDDAALIKEMENAFALIQPSLSEGFGLTGIEAMAAGVPVLASDIPIFREIYQDGATFFDPHYPTDLVRAINVLEKIDRQAVIKRGHAVSKLYSWQKTAAATLDAYTKVL